MQKVSKKIFMFFMFLLIMAMFCNNNVYAAYVSTPLETGSTQSSPIVNKNYSNFLGNSPINDTFGTAGIEDKGYITVNKVVSSGWFFWDEQKQSYPDKYYVVYKFPKRLNLRVEKLNEGYYYVSAGLTKQSTYTKEKGYSYTYEVSVGTELELKQSYSSELSVGGIEIYGAELGGKISSNTQISSKVSSTITKTTSYSYKQTVTESFTINSDKSSYYSYEKRGTFDLYVCQVYQVNYIKTSTRRNQWYQVYDYEYTVKDYTLIEQKPKLTYVDDTLEVGYYKYDKTPNGNFYYADDKTGNLVYY